MMLLHYFDANAFDWNRVYLHGPKVTKLENLRSLILCCSETYLIDVAVCDRLLGCLVLDFLTDDV